MKNTQLFTSLDRTYSCETKWIRPDRYRQLLKRRSDQAVICRGAGTSYVAASFGPESTVLDMSTFNRVLAFSPENKQITVEAGMNLGTLYSLLTPLNLTLAVQPGHPQITVGGCIAFDVHGKNQYSEGLFDSLVKSVELFHPDHGLIHLSRTKNSELFELTMGGFGLTGIIVSAVLRLSDLPGTHVAVERIPVSSLSETMEMMDSIKSNNDLLYSWNDLSQKNTPLGRGFLVTGNFIQGKSHTRKCPKYRLIDPNRRRFRPNLLTSSSIRFINSAYYHLHTTLKRRETLSFFECSYPLAKQSFYYDLYGKTGLIEQQVLIPHTKCMDYVKALEKLLISTGHSIFQASLKAFSGEQKYMRFCGHGVALTMDAPNTPETRTLFASIDNLNRQIGAYGNLGKDSRMDKTTAQNSYGAEYEAFKKELLEFDPKRIFRSELSTRLGI